MEKYKDHVRVKIHFLHPFLLLPCDVTGRLAGPNGFTNSTTLFQPLAEEGQGVLRAPIRPWQLSDVSGAEALAPEGRPCTQVMVKHSSPDSVFKWQGKSLQELVPPSAAIEALLLNEARREEIMSLSASNLLGFDSPMYLCLSSSASPSLGYLSHIHCIF